MRAGRIEALQAASSVITNGREAFGGFNNEWTVSPSKTSFSGHCLVRRNPLAAYLLHRIQLIEAWGRGISLILEKAPNPRFDQFAGTFTSTFPRTTTMEVAPQVVKLTLLVERLLIIVHQQ